MPVQNDTRLTKLVNALRCWFPTIRVRAEGWVEACRQEPSLIWQTPAVRYATYATGGLVLALALRFVVTLLSPSADQPVRLARTADIHVVCTDTACGKDFVINRPFDFDDFPVRCIHCDRVTGHRAMRCYGRQCRGHWVAPRVVEDEYRCPACDAFLGRER